VLAEKMAPDTRRRRPFLEYLGNFWFDLLVEHAALRRAIVEIVGVDHLLYSSNFGGADAIHFDLTDGIGLADAEREQIRSGNAARLLRIPMPTT
jgi:aminocarboxymuconate-semialdehyde decarboxylase